MKTSRGRGRATVHELRKLEERRRKARATLWSIYSLLERLHVVSDSYLSTNNGYTTVIQDGDFVAKFLKED